MLSCPPRTSTVKRQVIRDHVGGHVPKNVLNEILNRGDVPLSTRRLLDKETGKNVNTSKMHLTIYDRAHSKMRYTYDTNYVRKYLDLLLKDMQEGRSEQVVKFMALYYKGEQMSSVDHVVHVFEVDVLNYAFFLRDVVVVKYILKMTRMTQLGLEFVWAFEMGAPNGESVDRPISVIYDRIPALVQVLLNFPVDFAEVLETLLLIYKKSLRDEADYLMHWVHARNCFDAILPFMNRVDDRCLNNWLFLVRDMIEDSSVSQLHAFKPFASHITRGLFAHHPFDARIGDSQIADFFDMDDKRTRTFVDMLKENMGHAAIKPQSGGSVVKRKPKNKLLSKQSAITVK
jgi:hypothetical protein